MDRPGRVAVLGLGYIGLPTAAALATRGIPVVGVDIDPGVIDQVGRGEVPFAEPDLTVAVSGAVAMGRLSASKDVPEADAYVVAVPTPFTDGHRADLTFVRAAIESIAPRLRGTGEVVILESTSPPGTTCRVSRWLAELRPDLRLPHGGEGNPNVHVAHCPERVLPGRIMIEIVTNDRVIGGVTRDCAERAAALYRVFCQGELWLTDADSAEMSKLVENAHRDVNIAFANELSLICERLGLDVWEIRRMANHHPRVDILRPGPGVGGHCIAVDPWFIIEAAPEQARLMRTAREVNDGKPRHIADQIVVTARRFREPRIACLGLTFKADVEDMRESPAVDIVAAIATALPGVALDVVEPHVRALPQRLAACPTITLHGADQALDAALDAALQDADIVALLVDHEVFRSVKKSRLSGRVVYDTRGFWG